MPQAFSVTEVAYQSMDAIGERGANWTMVPRSTTLMCRSAAIVPVYEAQIDNFGDATELV